MKEVQEIVHSLCGQSQESRHRKNKSCKIVKRDKWNFYGGVAYEHELDGKASGKADGVEIRGADTSGASLRGELGATMKTGENSPWSLDLNVSGFAGKKQGFTGGVSVSIMF